MEEPMEAMFGAMPAVRLREQPVRWPRSVLLGAPYVIISVLNNEL